MSKGEYTKAIARLSRIRKKRNIKPSFSPDPGTITESPTNVMVDHLQGIYAGHLLPHTPPSPGNSPSRSSAIPFTLELCPFTSDLILDTLKQLPRKKAPGVDHIQTEMLLPLAPSLVTLIIYLFRLCWQWPYTPLSWRIAQVVPIHKKGSKSDPGNFRPISLTSIFRKLFEKCIYPSLLDQSPTLDIAQGKFRESRSALDQVNCLIEICFFLRHNHNCFPALAFLDIKSTYDTVDRSYIWKVLVPHLCPALLGILQNLFDQVQIEVLLDNRASYLFSPVTGVF